MNDRSDPSLPPALVYALVGLSLLLMALMGVAVWQENHQEWQLWQRQTRATALAEAAATYNQLAAGEGGEGDGGMLQAAYADLTRLQRAAVSIHQYWLPQLGRVDRCGTCHSPILLQESVLAHADHPFDEFGCTACHAGQGRATTQDAAHAGMWAGSTIEAACGRCHAGTEVPGAPVLSTGRRLFERAGCAGCHVLPGVAHETKVGATLVGLADRVRPEWLAAWLQAPVAANSSADFMLTWVKHRFTHLPARMPDYGLTPEEAGLLAAYLLSLPGDGRAVSASLPLTGDPEHGAGTFENRGCLTCHRLGNRGDAIGPDLTSVGDKAPPSALNAWLEDPAAILPGSRMPHFYLDPVERADLVAFLSQQRGSLPQPAALPVALSPAQMEQARQQVEELHCVGCHTIPDVLEKPGPGPDLSAQGDRWPEQLDFGQLTPPPAAGLADWLSLKLSDPRIFAPELRMPDLCFSSAEVEALVAALLSLSVEAIPADYVVPYDPPPPLTLGGRFGALDAEFRCTGCHRFGDSGGDVAPDLLWAGSKFRPEWLADYLVQPGVVRSLLQARMPRFGMTTEQVTTVLEYADVALRSPQVVPVAPLTVAEAPAGQALFEALPCLNCHSLGQTGELVGPDLTNVRDRLTPEWLVVWLFDPRLLDPRTEMPYFPLDEREARALAAYLFNWRSLARR